MNSLKTFPLLNRTNLSIYTIRLLFKDILIHHRAYTCWTKSIVTGRKLLLRYSSQWRWVFFNELQHIFSFPLVLTPSFQEQRKHRNASRVPWMQITAGTFDPYHRRKQWTDAAGTYECSMDLFFYVLIFLLLWVDVIRPCDTMGTYSLGTLNYTFRRSLCSSWNWISRTLKIWIFDFTRSFLRAMVTRMCVATPREAVASSNGFGWTVQEKREWEVNI